MRKALSAGYWTQLIISSSGPLALFCCICVSTRDIMISMLQKLIIYNNKVYCILYNISTSTYTVVVV